MSRRLSFRDVIGVVEKVPDLSGIVLVGGQALNFWAESLGIATAADFTGRYGPALSDDIDFLGPARAALALGEAVAGKVKIAGTDHANSPNTALVTLDIDGEEHLIDFLSDMKGFSPRELERVRSWAIPVTVGQHSPGPMHVMHPAHCLEAQLENVYGRGLDRRSESGGERYVGRVRLAIETCRRLTLRYLETGKIRSALKTAEKIHELSLLPAAMRARFEDGLHLEAGIPKDSMPPTFREQRYPQMQQRLERMIGIQERTRNRAAAKKR